MRNIYNSDNVTKNLVLLQKRMKITTNRSFGIHEIISAFNKLPGSYQDLLLKINKNENDKANLEKVYKMIKLTLINTKNVPEDIKIDIKNINSEEPKKVKTVTMEDVEIGGDRWVKPKEKKPVYIKEAKSKPELKIETPIIKKDTLKNDEESKKNSYKDVVLKKYIEQRKGLNIKAILKELNIGEEYEFIIESKFDNNSVVSNDELEKTMGIKMSYIDQAVDAFYAKAIEDKKNKIYILERK